MIQLIHATKGPPVYMAKPNKEGRPSTKAMVEKEAAN
jgi:hypothetical protein